MTRPVTSIYIASPEGETGKSTIALGVLHRLTAMVPRVGVFRPIIRRGDVDYILDTFPIVQRKDEAEFGEYRTKRLILERFDAMESAD